MISRLLLADEAAEMVGVKPATIRKWVQRRKLAPCAVDDAGRHLYLDRHVYEAERAGRRQKWSRRPHVFTR